MVERWVIRKVHKFRSISVMSFVLKFETLRHAVIFQENSIKKGWVVQVEEIKSFIQLSTLPVRNKLCETFPSLILFMIYMMQVASVQQFDQFSFENILPLLRYSPSNPLSFQLQFELNHFGKSQNSAKFLFFSQYFT